MGNILKSVNNKLTEITTYYLNHTSSSYVDIIEEAKDILENYYINEKKYIISKIESLLNEFETSTNNAIENEIKRIDIIYNNLENETYIIESQNEQDYERLMNSLNNTKKYISDIISRVKEFVHEEIGLKENGYFISNNEIQTYNNSFSYVISEANEISRQLDNDELIDKKFDEIMSNFRQNYTNIIKYMEKEKIANFILDEDTLKDSLFTESDKINIENTMKDLRGQVVDKIKEENKYYLDNVNSNISTFINEDLEQLNSLINDLDTNCFSEDSLKALLNSFDSAFNSCLSKVMKDIKKNEELANQYFDKIYNIMNDNNYLKNLLKDYKTSEIPKKQSIWIWFFFWIFRIDFDYQKFEDTISSKQKTKAYLSKYYEYISNFNYAKNYIESNFYLEIVNEYKKTVSSIRELLQTIKNINLVDKIPILSN